MERITKNRDKILLSAVSVILFFIPFFWLKPGEMDLGGDSSRLYFYDPIAYLKNYALYGVSPSGFGMENIGYYALPFVTLLVVLKYILQSPTILISLFHGVNLAVAFVSCYFIIQDLLERARIKKGVRFSGGLLSGLFYVFSQFSIQGWDKVLITHNQFFLNPLLFFLLLKYFKNANVYYLMVALCITFIFSVNFSFAAAPAFFAFYPLAIIFLLLYTKIIRKKPIMLKHLFIGCIVFVFLQAFHILPQIVSTFSKDSVLYNTVFSNSGKFNRGLSYFVAIAPNIKLGTNLLSLPQMFELQYYSFFFVIFPVIILCGFLKNKGKVLLLTGIFFLITLFFSTANITHIGFSFYKSLFYIPGFSMFRNFYGQWGYAYFFFYAILLGQAFAIVINDIKHPAGYVLTVSLILFLIGTALPFINGSLVNKVIWQSHKAKIAIRMDPGYEEILSFVKKLPPDGKVLTFPLSDPGYQMVAGKDGGAYQGPSTISYLAGKQDFAGFDELGNFNELILKLVKDKNYSQLREILGLLNIRYIFYNADSRIYDKTFPDFPYTYVRNFLPADQQAYKNLVSELSLKLLKSTEDRYFVYEIPNIYYRPTWFIASRANYFVKPVENWAVPLSFTFGKDTRNIYFGVPQNLLTYENIFTEATQTSLLLKAIKNPDPSLPIQHSFSTIPPWSPLYPFVFFKEELSMKRLQKNPEAYIAKQLFYSAKRITELENWGNDLSLEHSFKNDLQMMDWFKANHKGILWIFQRFFVTSNWEKVLTRYGENISESIKEVRQANMSEDWKITQKFLISEYLVDHRKRLINVLSGLSKKSGDKEYLDKLIDTLFAYLSNELNFPQLDPVVNSYMLPSTVSSSGAIFIEKSPYTLVQSEGIIVKANGAVIGQNDSQTENNWIQLGMLPQKGKSISIDFMRENSKNVLSESQFISLERTMDNSYVSWRNGLLWKVSDWNPESYYFISFEYLTHGVPYSIQLYEQEEKRRGSISVQLLNNPLKSRVWTHYQAVIVSGKNTHAAYLQIGGDKTESPLSQLELKNVALTYIPYPKIFLVEKNQDSHKKAPVINFEKVNPTKYILHIQNATDPYYLSFNEAFNRRWKLFFTPQRQFLENKWNFFENIWKQALPEKNHFKINGYANAWYITPQLTSGESNYTIVAEMTTQWYFYIGIILSVLMFFLMCVYTLYKVRIMKMKTLK